MRRLDGVGTGTPVTAVGVRSPCGAAVRTVHAELPRSVAPRLLGRGQAAVGATVSSVPIAASTDGSTR